MKRRTLAFLLLAAALSLTACNPTPASLKSPNMAPLSPRLQPLFEKTKTVCFGRFVMEVPASATVVYGPSRAPHKIVRLPDEAPNLMEWVKKEEDELKRQARYPKTKGLNLYEQTFDGAVAGQKIVVGYEGFDGTFYKVESFISVGSDVFVQTARADPDNEIEDKTLDRVVGRLNTIARHLRPRADGEVPTEPGICIDGGFLAMEAALSHELYAIGVRLAEFPDVHFSLSTTLKDEVVESDALEPRLQQAEADARKQGGSAWAWYSSVRMLRRGEREINGWQGFEVLAHKPAQGEALANHEFHFVSVGEANNPLRPQMDLRLNSGVEGNTTAGRPPSLSDEEAVALWDKLSSSIRVRSTTVKTSHVKPPVTPLGTPAVTGRLCPQSGWWICDEPGEVQGGHGRFLQAGQPMPRVSRPAQPTLMRKLMGKPAPYVTTATMWTLASYEAPAAPAPSVEPPSPNQTESKD